MMTDTYAYTSAWTESLKAEGKAEGLATMLLRVLEDKKVQVCDQARERILNCEDPAQVSAWATKVFEGTPTHADQLFEE